MKTIMIHFTSRKDKELFLKVLLLSTLAIGSYSNLGKLKEKGQSIKVSNVYYDNYGDFDRVLIPNKAPIISQMIGELRPNFSATQKQNAAVKIHQVFNKHKINPQIIVAILDTESSFIQEAVSTSGDLSIAQINPEVWNKEFQRMNLELIDVERLKTDEIYSLEKMAQILNILKNRYEKQDRRWYARYHSKTKKYKRAYLAKLELRLKRLEKLHLLEKNFKPAKVIAQLN